MPPFRLYRQLEQKLGIKGIECFAGHYMQDGDGTDWRHRHAIPGACRRIRHEAGRLAHNGGIGIIIKALLIKDSDQTKKQTTQSVSIDEACLLGFVPAVNCLTAIFGIGMSEVPVIWLGLSIPFLATYSVGLGNIWGKRTAKQFSSRKLNVISGVFLILVGFWELFV